MQDKRHEFRNDAITVTWSPRRCIHVTECVARLPRVFQPGERPWVRVAAATADVIAATVERCPTGALQYQRHDGGAAEAPDARNSALVWRNGPIYLRGTLEIRTPEGELVLADTRIALCRCGSSANKPLCDDAHHACGFRDPGAIADATGVAEALDVPAGDTLVVTPQPDGPVELSGPFVLGSTDGKTVLTGNRATLCRCGQSRNKPFCDDSHVSAGIRIG